MARAGFDAGQFPGVSTMAWIKSHTNLAVVDFYLWPAPSQKPNYGWMPQQAALVAQGWTLRPVYLGRQVAGPGSKLGSTVALARSQGALDGTNATELMLKAGFPPGSQVYLDLENGKQSAPVMQRQMAYVSSWAHAVESHLDRRFVAGVYCSWTIAPLVTASVPGTLLYVFRVKSTAKHQHPGTAFSTKPPSSSGVANAVGWQYEDNAYITIANGKKLLVDLDTWI